MIPADNTDSTERRAWWEDAEVLVNFPRPKELIAFATVNFPADVRLETLEAVNRVAEAYIAHCRKVGFWEYYFVLVPFHDAGLAGYRDRVKGYRAALKYFQRLQKRNRTANAGRR